MDRKRILIFLAVLLFLGFETYAAASKPKEEVLPPPVQKTSPTDAQAAVASTPGSVQVPPKASHWSDGWYKGAEGYAKALEEYEKTNKPMAVYVNVAWCPYCRKFEKEILSSPAVQAFLKDKIKVSINPESSKRENAIAFQYGVQGFPSFFVHPPQPSGTIRLSTGVMPEEFIELFKQVLK